RHLRLGRLSTLPHHSADRRAQRQPRQVGARHPHHQMAARRAGASGMSGKQRLRLGVDLGGTKTEVIALAPDGGDLVRRRSPTPSGDYRAQLALVREMVTGIEAELGAAGTVGVAIPGTISAATGLIKNANSTWLNGKPLDRDLAEALGRPVR